MTIRNSLYVIAHSDELAPGERLARVVMDKPIVLFRMRDERIGALADRCPHRLLPLSMGKVVDDGLQCGYHGARFNNEGACVWSPGPAEVSVRAFPVCERYGFIWIWPGDSTDIAPMETIPEFLEYGIPPYDAANGSILDFAADYRLLVDNLLDAAHASYVHESTLGAPLWQLGGEAAVQEDTTFEADVREDGIWYHYAAKRTVTGPAFAQAYARHKSLDEPPPLLDIDLDVQWAAPSVFIFSSQTRAPGETVEEGIGLINIHALTPAAGRSTHYFFRNAYRYHKTDPSFRDFWHEVASRAFHEDKLIIEAQQKAIGDTDVFDHEVISFPGDRLQFQGRQVLSRLKNNV
jgi:phenylpropionate dioxygenase-like ring-hydroxylating dioxygenase large terminal subunit